MLEKSHMELYLCQALRRVYGINGEETGLKVSKEILQNGFLLTFWVSYFLQLSDLVS